MVHPVGLEPTTLALKVRYSEPLNYGCVLLMTSVGEAGFEPACARFQGGSDGLTPDTPRQISLIKFSKNYCIDTTTL